MDSTDPSADNAAGTGVPSGRNVRVARVVAALVTIGYLWSHGEWLSNYLDCDTFDAASYDLFNSPNPPSDIAATLVGPVAGILVLVAGLLGAKIWPSSQPTLPGMLSAVAPFALLIAVVLLITRESSTLWNDCAGSIEMNPTTITLLLAPALLAFGLGRIGSGARRE